MAAQKNNPDLDTLKGFLKTGKSIDWISEKWNVTPQTVQAWFSKFNLGLPKKQSKKSSYTRKAAIQHRPCPVCHEKQQVNFLIAEKHWFCMKCETEFDQNNVIYIYDDKGELVEVIASQPDLWDRIKLGKAKKNPIRTITV